MKYLNSGPLDLNAESGEDAVSSTAVLEAQLRAIEERLRELPKAEVCGRSRAEHDISALLMALERKDEAWARARPLVDAFVDAEDWERAVATLGLLFACEQEDSLCALGQGVWMAVTFPIDPELTVAMLQHVVDETPDDSDGAAVAAATAAYVVDLRANGKQKVDLEFFTMQMLGSVARRHSGVHDQQGFSAWMEHLQLTEPDRFLVRLRNVIDVLVQDKWWLDRAAIQARLPVN
jgi:hypothetical protein